MQQMKNDRFLRVLNHQPVDRTPLWIMRQAGRYLPEYLKTRAQAGDFMTLCSTPDLACEVTLQPLRRYRLDAAIVFSDILTVPDAMGLGLHFEQGEGPVFARPVRTPDQVKQLATPDPETELRYVMDAIRLIRQELDGSVPLIGFAGSPWTVATYMVEGRGSKEYAHIKRLMHDGTPALHQLLDKITATTIDYLRAQIDAGAQALMVFDTWGGILSPANYREYSLAYMQSIVAAIGSSHADTPVTLFTKNGGLWLGEIAATGCACVGVDWTMDLADARTRAGEQTALQGNLDPGTLYGTPATIRRGVQQVLESYGTGHRHIFNLGHGIHQHIDPANVEIMVEAVHELSPAFHPQAG